MLWRNKIMLWMVLVLLLGQAVCRTPREPGWLPFSYFQSTVTNKLHRLQTFATNTRVGLQLAFDPNYGVDIDMEVYSADLSTKETGFNGNSNPESGSRVLRNAAVYYTHQLFNVNLPSTNAVPYSIIVTNNNIYLYEYYSILMMRQYQRSAHLVEVEGGCDLVITYDGRGVRPNDQIFLFNPSQTDLTNNSAAFASNLTSNDPKTLTVSLNAPGKWKMVIYHGQNVLTLDDYEVYVDTSPSPNSTCTNECSALPNTGGKAPNFDGTLLCYCENQYFWSILEQRCKAASQISYTQPVQSGNTLTTCDCLQYYYWDSTSELCKVNCQELGNNLGVFNDSADFCMCDTGDNEYWNIDQLDCNPCLEILHSTGNVVEPSCECEPGYVWAGPPRQDCVMDCSGEANAVGPHPDDIEKCECEIGYYWSNTASACTSCAVDNVGKFYTSTDPATNPPMGVSLYEMCSCAVGVMEWNPVSQDCGINCATITDSTGINLSPTECQCSSSYYWNSHTGCHSCSGLTYNDVGGTPVQNQCPCLSGFGWDTEIFDCAIDCSGVPHALGIVSADVCSCQPAYIWNLAQLQCVRECTGPYEVAANSPTVCDCDASFVWNGGEELCVIDCSGVVDTTGSRLSDGNGGYEQDECQCNTHYYWDPNTLTSEDCSPVQYSFQTNPPTTPNHCNCIDGYQWNPSTFACQINDCSQFPHSTTIDSSNGCNCETNYNWDAAVPECRIDCSALTNVVGVHPGDPHKCQCDPGFYWSNLAEECLSCGADGTAKFNTTTMVVVSPPPGLTIYEVCSCSLPYLSWDPAAEDCVLDCAQVQDSDGTTVSAVECQCDPTFFWDVETGCEDCGSLPRAVTDASVPNACACEVGFMWQAGTLICLIDWAAIPHATGNVGGTVDVCTCEFGFLWEASQLECVRECTGQYQSPILSASACSCHSGFVWNGGEQLCVIDCSGMMGTTGLRLTDGSGGYEQDECQCNDHYYWDQSTLTSISCTTVQDSSQANPPTVSNRCNCSPGFLWEEPTHTCNFGTNICSIMEYADTSVPYSISLGCQCQSNFYWNSEIKLCVRNCSLVEGAETPDQITEDNVAVCSCLSKNQRVQTNTTSSGDSSQTEEKATVDTEIWIKQEYTWDSETNTCVKLTTNAIILTIQLVPFAITMIFSVYMVVQEFTRMATQATQVLDVAQAA